LLCSSTTAEFSIVSVDMAINCLFSKASKVQSTLQSSCGVDGERRAPLKTKEQVQDGVQLSPACQPLQHVPRSSSALNSSAREQRPAERGPEELTAARESRLIKDHSGCHGNNTADQFVD
jgi:hypothetical protein